MALNQFALAAGALGCALYATGESEAGDLSSGFATWIISVCLAILAAIIWQLKGKTRVATESLLYFGATGLGGIFCLVWGAYTGAIAELGYAALCGGLFVLGALYQRWANTKIVPATPVAKTIEVKPTSQEERRPAA
jgi:TctA family transporter